MKEITKEEYQKMLDEHDWYFDLSDDHNVWKKGWANRNYLMEIARSNPIFEQMYKDKSKTIKL